MKNFGSRPLNPVRGLALGALLLPVVFWQGCSKIDGSYSTNTAPTVAFVNNEPDADGVQTNFHIDRYAFLMPDSLVGFEEASPANFPAPGAEDVSGVRFQLIHYQYLQIEHIDSIYVLDASGEWEQTVSPALYELDTNIGRYLGLTQPAIGAPFHWELNTNYVLAGDFTYRPVYSFSPMIFWAGSDPDGFVEEYRFTDHVYETDAALQTFLSQLRANPDMSGVDWTYTQNTQAVVNLTTQLGRIQKHALVVQSIDNDGQVSEPAYRLFNRSNRAPNTPRITYQKDGYNSVGQPENYTRHMIGWDDFIGDGPTATTFRNQEEFPELPCYNTALSNWNGIRFLISGDDPDDQAFVTIPLEFKYELVRFQGDEAALDSFLHFDALTDNGEWVASSGQAVELTEATVLSFDEYKFSNGWTANSILELFNLESGYYQLRVWTRDDGLESTAVPAWIRFSTHLAAPTRDVLLLNFTPRNLSPAQIANALGGHTFEEHAEFYRGMISEALGSITGVDPVWSTDVADDSYNCFYWELEDGTPPNFPDLPNYIPFSMMSDYRTVICVDDGYKGTTGVRNQITQNLKVIAMDYLDMGGSLFWTGYSSLSKSFGYNGVDINNTAAYQTQNAGDFLAAYLGVYDVYVDQFLTFQNSRGDGNTAGIPEFAFLDTLQLQQSVIDTMRADGNTFFNGRFDDGVDPFDWRSPLPGNAIPYVEAFSIYEPAGTQSVYTYNSYSAELNSRETFDIFRVVGASSLPPQLFVSADSVGGYGFDFSPDPDSQGCWVSVPDQIRNLQDITIFNAYEAHNLSRADEMWAQPVVHVTININARDRVFMYVQHQFIGDPAEYWTVGDTVSVDLLWQPILDKHRKVTTCYTENMNFSVNLGPIQAGATYTNFRTAFNSIPMYVMEYGELGTASPTLGLLPGPGALGLMQNVLYSFYSPKIQDFFAP